jgi:hypothetical protein
MLKLILAVLVALALVWSVGWVLVTTDHWPLDDRQLPARFAWAANGAVAHWLLLHSESAHLTDEELVAARSAIDADPVRRVRQLLLPAQPTRRRG